MDLFRHRAAEFGAEFVDLETVQFKPSLLQCVPAAVARRYRALPVSESSRCLVVVVSDPSDLPAVNGLHSALDKELELRVADKAQIDSFIQSLYGDDDVVA